MGGGGLVAKSCPILATPWTVTHQAPLSVEFPRQEYWSGLPVPTPGDFPDPEIKPASPTSPALAGKFFTTAPLGKPKMITVKPITISSLHIVTFCVCLIRTPRNLLSWQISSIQCNIISNSRHAIL